MPNSIFANNINYFWSYEYYQLIEQYKNTLAQNGYDNEGEFLPKQIKDYLSKEEKTSLNDISIEEFAVLLIRTKQRIYMAEQDQARFTWTRWPKNVTDILFNLVTMVADVDVLTTEARSPSDRYIFTGTEAHQALMVFLNGRVLTPSKEGYVNYQYENYIEDNKLNAEKLKVDLKNELLVMLNVLNAYGKQRAKKLIIPSPGVGTGAFGDKFKDLAGDVYVAAMQELLTEYTFSHIGAVILDLGKNDVSDIIKNEFRANTKYKKQNLNNTTLITRIRNIDKKDYPQLQREAAWYQAEYELPVAENIDYQTIILLAADGLSCLLNEGLNSSAQSNEATAAMTTNAITKIYDIFGTFDKKSRSYVPLEEKDWRQATEGVIPYQPSDPNQIYIQLGKHIIKSSIISAYKNNDEHNITEFAQILNVIETENGQVDFAAYPNFTAQKLALLLVHLANATTSTQAWLVAQQVMQSYLNHVANFSALNLQEIAKIFQAYPNNHQELDSLLNFRVSDLLTELSTQDSLSMLDVMALEAFPRNMLDKFPQIFNKIENYFSALHLNDNNMVNYLPYIHKLSYVNQQKLVAYIDSPEKVVMLLKIEQQQAISPDKSLLNNELLGKILINKYDFCLVTDLANGNQENAEIGKIYLAADHYIMRDIRGEVQTFYFQDMRLDDVEADAKKLNVQSAVLHLAAEQKHVYNNQSKLNDLLNIVSFMSSERVNKLLAHLESIDAEFFGKIFYNLTSFSGVQSIVPYLGIDNISKFFDFKESNILNSISSFKELALYELYFKDQQEIYSKIVEDVRAKVNLLQREKGSSNLTFIKSIHSILETDNLQYQQKNDEIFLQKIIPLINNINDLIELFEICPRFIENLDGENASEDKVRNLLQNLVLKICTEITVQKVSSSSSRSYQEYTAQEIKLADANCKEPIINFVYNTLKTEYMNQREDSHAFATNFFEDSKVRTLTSEQKLFRVLGHGQEPPSRLFKTPSRTRRTVQQVHDNAMQALRDVNINVPNNLQYSLIM